MQRAVNEFDILKSIAIVLVVIGHITILYNPELHPESNTRIPELITRIIYIFHMPLFMAISGAIYAHNRLKPSYTKFRYFAHNKFMRIIVPYFLVGLCALLPVMVYTKPDIHWYDPGILSKIVFAHDCRHLWYLLALAWIFLLQYLSERIGLQGWRLLGVSLILTISQKILFPDLRFMCLYLGLHNWPYFIMGTIMATGLRNLPFLKTSLLAILGAGICIAVTATQQNYYVDMAISFITPIFICAIFVVSARQITLNEWWEGTVRLITSYCFGIYLFHVMVIFLLHKWLGDVRMEFMIPMMFVAAIATSIAFTWLLRRLHLGLVVGEYRHSPIKKSSLQ